MDTSSQLVQEELALRIENLSNEDRDPEQKMNLDLTSEFRDYLVDSERA